jgi:hypothetical protein
MIVENRRADSRATPPRTPERATFPLPALQACLEKPHSISYPWIVGRSRTSNAVPEHTPASA